MNSMIEHLEPQLGPIQYGWKDSEGLTWPFDVLGFGAGPIANTRRGLDPKPKRRL
jgi:hypothetical protein